MRPTLKHDLEYELESAIKDAYVSVQGAENQWRAAVLLAKDGTVEVCDPIYGVGESEDQYYGRVYTVHVARGWDPTAAACIAVCADADEVAQELEGAAADSLDENVEQAMAILDVEAIEAFLEISES